jgi:carboxyl-terminal processing protease
MLLSREHEARVANNPDFVAFQADVEALEILRNQREVSLNLEQRRTERDAIDSDRLQRENARRAARGLAPLADVGALDGAEAPDAVLDEAVEIAADAALLPSTQEPARLS